MEINKGKEIEVAVGKMKRLGVRKSIEMIQILMFFMAFVFCLSVPDAEARKCDLQVLQDKVNSHLSDSIAPPLKGIAFAYNMKNGVYYFYAYDPAERLPSARNIGFRKMALFLCRPVMVSITSITGDELDKEIRQAGINNLQVNYNFRKSRLKVLMRQPPLGIREEKE